MGMSATRLKSTDELLADREYYQARQWSRGGRIMLQEVDQVLRERGTEVACYRCRGTGLVHAIGTGRCVRCSGIGHDPYQPSAPTTDPALPTTATTEEPTLRSVTIPFDLVDPQPHYAPNSLSDGGWPTDEDGYER